MFRVLIACLLLTIFAAPSATAQAGMKLVTVGGGTIKAMPRHARWHHRWRHHRRLGFTAFAVPRCQMVPRTSYNVYWRGLACPRIAWAGSAPRQPWSYSVFRTQAQWDQRIELWQSHFAPSPSIPTIYWGY